MALASGKLAKLVPVLVLQEGQGVDEPVHVALAPTAPPRGCFGRIHLHLLLGGSWVVISGVLSRVTIVIIYILGDL